MRPQSRAPRSASVLGVRWYALQVEIVIPCYDYDVGVWLAVKPVECLLQLGECADLCEVPSVDEDVARRITGWELSVSVGQMVWIGWVPDCLGCSLRQL